MNRNWIFLLALMLLPLLRLMTNELHYDETLGAMHYTRLASFIKWLHDNDQFQSFCCGWVFPAFLSLVLAYWAIEEDKSRIPTQFLLLPLAYIPFSIVGFTLVHAEFDINYLYANPLIILTFGYAYVLFWMGLVKLLDKLKLVQ